MICNTEKLNKIKLFKIYFQENSFKFCGFYVGFSVVATLMIIIVVFLTINIFIFIYLIFGNKTFTKPLKKMLPLVLTVLIQKVSTLLLVKYVFLQPKTKILAINNRKFFSVFCYFDFFLDCFLG